MQYVLAPNQTFSSQGGGQPQVYYLIQTDTSQDVSSGASEGQQGEYVDNEVGTNMVTSEGQQVNYVGNNVLPSQRGVETKPTYISNFTGKVIPRQQEVRHFGQAEVQENRSVPSIPRYQNRSWTRKGQTGIESPNGTNFLSKHKAIEHLVSTGGSRADIELIKDMYFSDGWTRENLPEGWMGKEHSGHGYSFISPDGQNFKVRKSMCEEEKIYIFISGQVPGGPIPNSSSSGDNRRKKTNPGLYNRYECK